AQALANHAWSWIAAPTRSVGNIAYGILGTAQSGISNMARTSAGFIGSFSANTTASFINNFVSPLGIGLGSDRRDDLHDRITDLLKRISPNSSESFNYHFVTNLSNSLAALLAPVIKGDTPFYRNLCRFAPLENPRGQEMLANFLADTLLSTTAALLAKHERDPSFFGTTARELKAILIEDNGIEKNLKATAFVDKLFRIIEVENGSILPINTLLSPLNRFLVPKLRNNLIDALKVPNPLGSIVNFQAEVVDDDLGRVEAECCELLGELATNSLLGEANPENFHALGRPAILALQELIDRKIPDNHFRLTDWIANGEEIAQIVRNFITEDGRAAIRGEIQPFLTQVFRYGASRLLVPIRDLDIHGPLALSNNHLVAVSATVAESVNHYLGNYLENPDTTHNIHGNYDQIDDQIDDPEKAHLQAWCQRLIEIAYPNGAAGIPLPDETRSALYYSLCTKTLPELVKDGIETLTERSFLNETIVDCLGSDHSHSPPSLFESPFGAVISFGRTCTRLFKEVSENALSTVIITWNYLARPIVNNDEREDTRPPPPFGIRDTRKDLGEISFKLGKILAPKVSEHVHGVNNQLQLLGIDLNQVIGESIASGIAKGMSGKTIEMLAIKALEELRDKSLEKYKAAPPRRLYTATEVRQLEANAKKALARNIRQALPTIISQYFTDLRKRWDDRFYDLETIVQGTVNSLYQTPGKKRFFTVPLAFALKKLAMPILSLSNFLAFNTLRVSLGLLGKTTMIAYSSFPKPISKALTWLGNKLVSIPRTRDFGESLQYLAKLERNKVDEVMQFIHSPMHKKLIWKLGDILLLGDAEPYAIFS
ncbi:MAG: hypothetical protein ACI9YB_002288, partial [Halioglobus sp.]